MRCALEWIGTFGICGALAATGGCATSAVFEQELTKTNTQTVLAFEETVFNKHDASEAFAHYVGPNFIEHDPRLGGRAQETANVPAPDARNESAGANAAQPDPIPTQGALEAYQVLLSRLGPGSQRMFLRTIAQGELVATESRWNIGQEPAINVVDIYRLSEGRIVEHWDVVQGRGGRRGAVPGSRLPP